MSFDTLNPTGSDRIGSGSCSLGQIRAGQDKDDTGYYVDWEEGSCAVPAAPVTSTRIGSFAIGAGGGGAGELREGSGARGFGSGFGGGGD